MFLRFSGNFGILFESLINEDICIVSEYTQLFYIINSFTIFFYWNFQDWESIICYYFLSPILYQATQERMIASCEIKSYKSYSGCHIYMNILLYIPQPPAIFAFLGRALIIVH